jgi:hypothetical protein
MGTLVNRLWKNLKGMPGIGGNLNLFSDLPKGRGYFGHVLTLNNLSEHSNLMHVHSFYR